MQKRLWFDWVFCSFCRELHFIYNSITDNVELCQNQVHLLFSHFEFAIHDKSTNLTRHSNFILLSRCCIHYTIRERSICSRIHFGFWSCKNISFRCCSYLLTSSRLFFFCVESLNMHLLKRQDLILNWTSDNGESFRFSFFFSFLRFFFNAKWKLLACVVERFVTYFRNLRVFFFPVCSFSHYLPSLRLDVPFVTFFLLHLRGNKYDERENIYSF